MEMGAGGGALLSVVYAVISLPCAVILLVVGDVGIRLATLALRGELDWRPSRGAMLGFRMTRPVHVDGGGGQAEYPSALPDDDDDDDELLPPVPAEHRDRLAVAVYRRGSGQEQAPDPDCAFCLSAVRDGEEVRELRCRHVFHRACIDDWLLRPYATCPLCRDRLIPPTASEIDFESLTSSSASAYAHAHAHAGALWHMTT